MYISEFWCGVGMNLKTVNYNTGDTYKYYDQPMEDELKPWNI